MSKVIDILKSNYVILDGNRLAVFHTGQTVIYGDLKEAKTDAFFQNNRVFAIYDLPKDIRKKVISEMGLVFNSFKNKLK